MGKWDGLDRRKFPRVNYPCLVIIRNDNRADDEVILTHTENIGLGGVCVILKRSLDMFSPVELEVDLLDLGNHIRCKGKVVWNVRRKVEERKKPLFFDVGIEFQALPKGDSQRIEDVIKRLVKNHQEAPYSGN